MKAWQKAAFFILGALALWFITMMLQSFAHAGPDRANIFQIPLLLIVLAFFGLAHVLRRRHWLVLATLLPIVQLGAYVLYETGISIETNIRVDLLLIYPAILFTAW